MNIVLLGPQGSGKSTQAKKLAEYLKLPYFSMGEQIKYIDKNPSHKLHKLIKSDFESGKLVSNAVVNKILGDFLESSISLGFVIDGTPRNVNQALYLDEFLAVYDKKLDLAVFIDTTVEECKKRILKRVQIEHRADDTPEAVEQRLNIYFTKTKPILDVYKKRDILVTINGDPSPEEVWILLKDSVNKVFNLV